MMEFETLKERWYRLLYDHYRDAIEDLAARGEKSLYLNYDEAIIYDADPNHPDLIDYTLDHPHVSLRAARHALQEIETAYDQNPRFARLVGLPDVCHRDISALRCTDHGCLVSLNGIVKRKTTVYPRSEVAVFECMKCGALIKIKQDGLHLQSPNTCPESQGGCGRKSSFKHRSEEDVMHDMQKIELQENPEDIRGDRQPETITVYLEHDLAGTVNAGKRVNITGVMQVQQKRKGRTPLTEYDKIIDAVSIEQKDETTLEEIDITNDEEETIKEIANNPDIYERFIDSVAPTIYGHREVKEALVYQMFGGSTKHMPDGTRIRGDIHILLCGDPATAKSQLLKYVNNIVPRSIMASGKDATAAGLTVAATKDTAGWGEGGWVLEAGAMVLADRGLVAIDELDKMRSGDRSAMHQAMEQQEISVAKAGINTTLKSRCAVLAAANPKLGRLDRFTAVPEQINLPPALVSRFDLIFLMYDTPDEDDDRAIAQHILRVHRAGEEMGLNTESHIDDMEHLTPSFDPGFMRKYIAYAKQKVHPCLTRDAEEEILDYYTTLRSLHQDEGDSIPITHRDVEAITRLAEASARVRLSEQITREDAHRARKIMEVSLGESATDENGNLDRDTVYTGQSKKQQSRQRWIMDYIVKNDGATREDIILAARANNYNVDHVLHDFDKMIDQALLFQPPGEEIYKRA